MRRSLQIGAGLAALSASAVACLPYPEWRAPRSNPDPRPLYEDYRRGTTFHTPWQSFDVGATDMLRWIVSANPYRSQPTGEVATVANDGTSLSGHADAPEITWIGHSTFAIHDGDDVVLTDPHFGERALIPARQQPPGVPISAIPPDAFAVISHNHYDHLDAYTVDTLPATVQWFVPLGLAQWFRERDRTNVVELGWWESSKRGRWTVTCLPSQHWSRRIGQPTNTTLWCAWMLESEEHTYFFAGDTGYFAGFAEFGRKYPDIDVALMPIGAYAPRWFMHYQHMDPEEALRAFRDLNARYMLPMHWGTFDLTDEPIDEAPRELARAMERANVNAADVPQLAIGERWILRK